MKEVLIDALRQSGDVLLSYFNKPLVATQKESISSVVTAADLESERLLIELISNAFPGHNIIAEESGFINRKSAYTWVVDPLDGTSNFAAGIPWFGVLISVFKNNETIMGGAYLPVTDTLYFTEKGNGVFRNDERLPLLSDKKIEEVLFAFCTDYSEDLDLLQHGIACYKHLLKVSRNIRATNCLIDFLYVVEGKFGGVMNLNTRIWDIAALSLMISEVGGEMKDFKGSGLSINIDEAIISTNFPVIAATANIINSSGLLNL
jgi:myo-inositol-1(or 4)-monophosphatase